MDLQSLFLPLLIVLLAVPLFLQARKQKRAVAEQQKLQNSIEPGDRVMTTSGVFGTVVSTSDDSIDLELAPGLTTTWVRQAVREKVNTDTDSAAEQAETPADDAADDAKDADVKDAGATDVKDADEAKADEAKVAEPTEQKAN